MLIVHVCYRNSKKNVTFSCIQIYLKVILKNQILSCCLKFRFPPYYTASKVQLEFKCRLNVNFKQIVFIEKRFTVIVTTDVNSFRETCQFRTSTKNINNL